MKQTNPYVRVYSQSQKVSRPVPGTAAPQCGMPLLYHRSKNTTRSTRMILSLLFSLSLVSISVHLSDAQEKTSAEQPRAARSVHLWYPAPESTIFYNEMTIEQSHPGSYFMACGFNHGYFGLQEIRNSEDKVAIFSVWDPGNQNDPNAVAPEERVKILYEGEGVNVSRFGNEGTGGKSMFPYAWNIGETYKFLVKAEVEENRTTYAAYFYLNESKTWKHLVTFQTLTNGDYLKGYYSFIEDFHRNGVSATQIRRAQYGNGWVKSIDGAWVSLTQATFTADKTPTDNINAGVTPENRFFLQNGGDTQNIVPLKSKLTRLPDGLSLPIDLD